MGKFKKEILIGIGCSHTQGCAFVKDGHKPKKIYELKTQSLKTKYKKDFVDQEFLTELSWLGKLNQHLNFKKVLNFGTGGSGIENNIHSINSYILKNENLNNHLFIWQVPSFDRHLLSYRLNKKEEFSLETYTNLITNRNFNFLEYIDYFFDDIYQKLKLIETLYLIQRFIESQGGVIYFIFKPLCSIDFLNKENMEYYDKLFKHIDDSKFFLEFHKKENIKKYFDKLKVLSMKKFTIHNTDGKSPAAWRLHEEGLVKNDFHYSENGNEIFAKHIYNELINIDKRLR